MMRGGVQSIASTAPTTDDIRPGIKVGPGLTDKPALYVDGVKVPATYNLTSGTLTPDTTLGGSRHQVTTTLTEAVGNESAQSPALSLTVDLTPPGAGTVSLSNFTDTGSSNSDRITSDSTFDLTFTGQDAGSSVDWQRSTDGGTTWVSVTAAQNILPNGSYLYRAQVRDAAGNSATTPTTTAVTLDGTAPAAGTVSLSNFADSGGSSDRLSTDNTFDLTLTGQEAASTVIWLRSTDNGATWTATSVAQSGLTDGTFQYRAQVTDTAGNSATANVLSVTVGNRAPKTGSVLLSSFTDTGSDTTDNISTDTTFDLMLSGQEAGSTVAWERSTDGGTTWTATTAAQNALTDRNYHFRAQVTDAAGNSAAPVSVTVDTTAPALSLKGMSNDLNIAGDYKIYTDSTVFTGTSEAGGC